jgi:hypothetical protein
MNAFRKNVSATKTTLEMEQVITRRLDHQDLWKSTSFDHGEIVHKGATGMPSIVRLVVGNPLIMRQMVKHVPDTGSYAPVTILIDERPDGNITGDRASSHARATCEGVASSGAARDGWGCPLRRLDRLRVGTTE